MGKFFLRSAIKTVVNNLAEKFNFMMALIKLEDGKRPNGFLILMRLSCLSVFLVF